MEKQVSGINRRELWVDARDLQSEQSDGGEHLTEQEYREILKTRGQQKLAEAQLVENFDSTARTYNPTYELGVDFFLGDKITVVDERLCVIVDAVVQGASHYYGDDGEKLSLIFGYEKPTLYERLKRKG